MTAVRPPGGDLVRAKLAARSSGRWNSRQRKALTGAHLPTIRRCWSREGLCVPAHGNGCRGLDGSDCHASPAHERVTAPFAQRIDFVPDSTGKNLILPSTYGTMRDHHIIVKNKLLIASKRAIKKR
jgi:hypothetical protein